jgi:hypothetical protein
MDGFSGNQYQIAVSDLEKPIFDIFADAYCVRAPIKFYNLSTCPARAYFTPEFSLVWEGKTGHS